ncbi:MAG: hypothetical protein IT458_20560 [Planctomycetes bacterium]|nr:hypothetical protein [Planctomycetota bacterium]
MHTRIGLAAALAIAALPPAPQDRKPAEPVASPQTLVLEAGAHELEGLTDRVARFLGRNILYLQEEFGAAQARVQLQQRLELDPRAAEEVYTQLLGTRGFVLTAVDEARGVYEVVFENGPRRIEILNRAKTVAADEVLARPGLRVPVRVVVPLQHLNAQTIQNSLRPMLPGNNPGSLLVGNIGQGSLLLQGLSDQVAQVLRQVRAGDQPQPKLETSTEERLNRIEMRLSALEKKVEAR